ncbi:hypothetical protein F383_32381 [Gossypium arboreum]|uniref:Uncharacterized protein n=1 Tax=Gossypium arboreum TaxID=29729 RepID=A0A0B0MVA7_GOSAR|nr:hypothetical protein F383_32381 [Gossypium arboreum]
MLPHCLNTTFWREDMVPFLGEIVVVIA